MHKKFIINEQVCFHSEEHRLEPIKENGTAITLNAPVSRCLLLLLLRAGEVISQRELVYEVWESKGQFANANTYFQNIHLLRKALKIAGFEENIIKTVPKEGIRLVGTVTYHEEDSETNLINRPEDNVPNDFPSPSEEKLMPDSTPLSTISIRHRGKRVSLVLIMAFSTLFIFLIFRLYSDLVSRNSFFNDYQLIGEVNQCQIYANSNAVLRQHAEYLAFIQDKNIQCQSGQVAYIVMNVAGTRTLVHICDANVNNTASCLTKLYIVEKKDE